MRTIWAYCRVSTMNQAANGHSLQTQKQLLQDYVARVKLQGKLVWVSDTDSASKIRTDKRDGWCSMSLQDGDAIVATRIDRVFRSMRDATSTVADLQKKNVQLHFVDGGALGNGSAAALTFNLLASVAQFESSLKGERIAEVKQAMKAAGLFVGGTRELGTTRGQGKELAQNPSEIKILKLIQKFKTDRDTELREGNRQRCKINTLNFLQKKIEKINGPDISGRWSEGFLWGLVNGKIDAKLARLERLV